MRSELQIINCDAADTRKVALCSRRDDYTELGQDEAECDVEYARFAQAEVMLDDPPYLDEHDAL